MRLETDVKKFEPPRRPKNVFPGVPGDKGCLAPLSAPNGLTQHTGARCLLSGAHFICKHVVTSGPPLPLCVLVTYFQPLGRESALRHRSLVMICCTRWDVPGSVVFPSWPRLLNADSRILPFSRHDVCSLLPRSFRGGSWQRYFLLVSDLFTRIEEDLAAKKQWAVLLYLLSDWVRNHFCEQHFVPLLFYFPSNPALHFRWYNIYLKADLSYVRIYACLCQILQFKNTFYFVQVYYYVLSSCLFI